MWIDPGIDTAHILLTEFTEFEGKENLSKVHLKVIEDPHRLHLDSVKCLASGESRSIPQKDIAKGKTYYTKDWTLIKKALVLNFKNFKKSVFIGKNIKS